MAAEFKAGLRVRLKSNSARVGVLSGDKVEHKGKVRWEVHFPDVSEWIPELALEPVSADGENPFEAMRRLRFGKPRDLRTAITYYRLSGKLADLIYSLNTTNTEFYAYQFKPVLNFLDSPSRGLLIADEVGLGKTIEAGLIWTELRSREDARRLLVLCPAMLREKWRIELADRFGIDAEICSAEDVLRRIEDNLSGRRPELALIASLQGLRPPSGWSTDREDQVGSAARLARFLNEQAVDEPLFDLVIIDEAHYLRNRETQTANLGRLIRPVTDNLVLLSATPVQLRSGDLFQLLNLLDADSFPYEWSFEEVLKASGPLIRLRDHVLTESLSPDEFSKAIGETMGRGTLFGSEVLEGLIRNPPTADELAEPAQRVALAERLDRVNPLTKVVSRTRKRDVHERRVLRRAHALRALMGESERAFYDAVTERVRKHCHRLDIAHGFLVTIPQRQMCSSMAAACRAWQQRIVDADVEEAVWEAFGMEGGNSDDSPSITPLIAELARIAQDFGDYEELRRNDSKFSLLWEQLDGYWRNYPDGKVVLFAYFRETLRYLRERLDELGVGSALVMGGMDKDAVLREFARPEGPRILLATEVASEGIDLQFSSLLVNYDLPWNPMRIEQRIGRIDRIGQKADVILIWNLFCRNTLDDRVYTRLFERLKIFEQALGTTEAILGAEIRAMSYELLSHRLSPEEEISVIEQTRVAVENGNRLQEQLEEEAIRLAAHGDYIQQRVSLARQLNRFITGRDLYTYAKDFLDIHYPGCRFIAKDEEGLLVEIELTAEARAAFSEFLKLERMQGRTRLADAGGGLRLCHFENRLQRPRSDREVISQYHPLVAFVAKRLRSEENNRSAAVVALEIGRLSVPDVPAATYAFAVQRWSFSGERDMERLSFVAKRIGEPEWDLPLDLAERLVNTAAGTGRDWLNVRGELDGNELGENFNECVDALDRRFDDFVNQMQRENRDRIGMQLEILKRQEQRKAAELEGRIARLRAENRTRVIPALQGQVNKNRERASQRRALLEGRRETRHEARLVAGGVILVT